ncbi:cytochrome P450 [Saccharopolyspora erythraea]|uniref:bifunctional cytochrome P450/NADPH--P450 reductase n=1 Tax=Saccharopolyspora erythraea TaxID=1836 RepID=UPI001BADB0DF|nr:cytochrome P450 [Saccharopolyspora erythraea]QUH02694.1 cytochrome P450 [Saccharopolyspora erythraea]
MSAPITVESLPSPRGLPVLGNIFCIDSEHPVESLVELGRELGPIFRLDIPGSPGGRVFAWGQDLVADLCDDNLFDKRVTGGLGMLRRGTSAGNGLFTSETADPLWRRAHNILMPSFSQQAMSDYLPMMTDIAGQLVQKWERLNPGDEVDVTADTTRLTLDTIALCGFGYRFNSFYREDAHPFVAAMMRVLAESQARIRQLPVQTRLRVRARRRLDEDNATMERLVDQVIQQRRESGETRRDLLGAMLDGVDRQTGERLPDANIRAQCVTFMIAGHETTSGLLSFVLYFLLKNPDVAERAYAEVDRVVGSTAEPTLAQLGELGYLRQIVDETLRLWPTAPAFTRAPYQDAVIGGRYLIPAGTPVTVVTPMLHRDQRVWGTDAEEFHPEHFDPQRREALPPHSFKPFGTGQRACIGQQFARQEAMLVLAMLLQRFEFADVHDYRLSVRTTLTLKPDGMHVQVRPRPGRKIDAAAPRTAPPAERTVQEAPAAPRADAHDTPLLVLFGSNLGTSESIASRIAQDGTRRGFDVGLGPLDDYTDALPDRGAVVVVSASYNGTPPDNAGRFCAWISDPATSPDACAGLHYAVFGCGSTDWASTYQAVPTLLDEQFAAHGALRAYQRGEGNAQGDFDEQYHAWYQGLWPALTCALGLEPELTATGAGAPRLAISLVNKQTTNPVVMSYRARPATVRVNRELLHHDGDGDRRSTRHLDVALPAGMDYSTGDHLGVLPRNDVELIRRAILRFGLDAGMYVTITPTESSRHTHLPLDEPAPLLGVLASCVELQDTATREQIELLAEYTDDSGQRERLRALAKDTDGCYRTHVFEPRRSVLELLEEHPGCALPFEVFLDMLPPLRPRYYSISSAPGISSDTCSITTGVLCAPARSGVGEYRGICSNHLARSPAKATVFVFVRKPTIAFRPPENPHTPMIMIGAGTGLAPFRGFLQDRAVLAAQGVPVGRSLLFFGCRNPEVDYLYSDELRDFQQRGVVEVHPAFSRVPGKPRCYVQDQLRSCGDEVMALLDAEAVVYVCGNASTMAPAVRAAFTDLFRARTGTGQADAEAWLAGLKSSGRYLEDIWGG